MYPNASEMAFNCSVSPCQIGLALINDMKLSFCSLTPSQCILNSHYLWPSSPFQSFISFPQTDDKVDTNVSKFHPYNQPLALPHPGHPNTNLIMYNAIIVIILFILFTVIIDIKVITVIVIISVNEKLLGRFCPLLLRWSEKLFNLLGSRRNLTFSIIICESCLWQDNWEMLIFVRKLMKLAI